MTDHDRDTTDPADLTVHDIGGITHATATFEPGLTILTGENATNRSSLLRGLMAALGSTNVSIRTGADRGRATLTIDDTTYTATVTRTDDGNRRFDGDRYINDPSTVQAADLFAFLVQDNPIRQTIRDDPDGAALRELLMRPVDIDDLERQLSEIRAEIAELEGKQDRLNDTVSKLPNLRDRRDELLDERDELSDRIAHLKTEIESLDLDMAAVQRRDDEIATLRDDLTAAHDELADMQIKRNAELDRLETLTHRRDDLRAKLDDLEVPDADADELKARRDDILDRLDNVETELQRIDDLIEINESFLTADGSAPDITEATVSSGRETGGSPAQTDGDAGALIDEHFDSTAEETVCWTCGQHVATDCIETTIADLKSVKERVHARREDLIDERDDLESRLNSIHEKREERAQLNTRLTEVEDNIDEVKHTIDELEKQIDEQQQRIADINDRLEETNLSDQHDRLLELHNEHGETRQQYESIKRELDSVEEKISDAETAADRLDEVESRLADKKEDRAHLKTLVRDREKALVETFNDQMAAVLEELQLDRIERIRLNRRVPTQGSTADPGLHDNAVFEVEVARTVDGTVYRDTVRHLSGAEREVVGLVLALTGYLVHSIYEEVPVVVVDAIEAVDAARVEALLTYIDDYADFTAAAVLDADVEASELPTQADMVIAAESLADAD